MEDENEKEKGKCNNTNVAAEKRKGKSNDDYVDDKNEMIKKGNYHHHNHSVDCLNEGNDDNDNDDDNDNADNCLVLYW